MWIFSDCQAKPARLRYPSQWPEPLGWRSLGFGTGSGDEGDFPVFGPRLRLLAPGKLRRKTKNAVFAVSAVFPPGFLASRRPRTKKRPQNPQKPQKP